MGGQGWRCSFHNNVADKLKLNAPRAIAKGFSLGITKTFAISKPSEFETDTAGLRADLTSGALHHTFKATLPADRADFPCRLVIAEG